MNDLLSRDYSSKGWTPERVAVFREEFGGFLNVCKVNSKEVGPMILGENLYHAQNRFLDFVFDCLGKDIHDIKHLKSRQLGVSTISRALTLFWAGVHDGLRGYMVYDTQPHTEEARLELIEMLVNLPDEYAFPRIARQNRYMVRLENDTVINFASAGVKESKSTGTLGRSSGINFHHGSEICSWHGGESIESYKNALAKTFPNRLYVWESTGRGPNIWKDMCDEAEADPHHQAFLFSGWWCHNLQRIERDDPDYERYTSTPLSDGEHRRIRAVYERYGHTITPEQLAWIRRYMDPGREIDEGERSSDEIFRLREQAWTSDEAWLLTSRGFFPAQELSDIKRSHGSNRFRAYTYSLGLEFHHTRISPTINPRLFELKVWDEPQEGACYIVSADVAHGANEHNDHSTAQVLRAYADGLDQVAEFSSPVVNTTQYAWVLASLAGWYAGSTSQVTVIIEIQGGGDATWREFQGLKRRIAQGYQAEEIRERGLQNLFHNVRNYMYTRSDSIGGASRNYQWKTNYTVKPSMMEQMRGYVMSQHLIIRSETAYNQMQAVVREGDSISAATGRDDNVISLAIGCRCWDESLRPKLVTARRTREIERARTAMSISDMSAIYNKNVLEAMFSVKYQERLRERAVMAAEARRFGGRRRR